MIHLPAALAILLAALAQAAAPQTVGSSTDAPAPGQDIVTREWTWTDANGVTVLTVEGPADQVAQFEPGDPTSECPDCLMLSSVAYEQAADPATLTLEPAQPSQALGGQDR